MGFNFLIWWKYDLNENKREVLVIEIIFVGLFSWIFCGEFLIESIIWV